MRVALEKNYKNLKKLWKTQGFPRKINVRRSSVDVQYNMSALLTNYRVGPYEGGQRKAKLDYPPPTLEEYISKGIDEK